LLRANGRIEEGDRIMWDVFARLKLVALGLGVLAAGSVVEASQISFKAVKRNDVAITPTNNLSVVANDKIEVEMFLSAWANDWPVDATPNNVRTFQVQLNRAGYVSSDNGTAKPLGWCGPANKITCTEPATCPPEYSICLTNPSSGCTCSPHNPDLGGFITASRADYLLFELDQTGPIIVTTNIDFLYTSIGNDSSVSVQDTGASRYLGTLIVKVSANACGTFTLGFVQDSSVTFIADPANNASLPGLTPLVLTVSNCSRQLLSCGPTHCNIDARIAHDRLDQTAKKNAFQMAMQFSKSTIYCNNAPTQICTLNSECPAGGTCNVSMTAADFDVTVAPYLPDGIDDDIRTITTVTPNGADPRITTLTLDRRIRQMRWVCIRDKGSNKRCCMGSLPADADNSRLSQSDDVGEVFDNLLGGLVIPALTKDKCDTDRSLLCTPADILMVVDLLNGADAFDEVNGDSLPALINLACPSMNLPP